MQTLGLYIAVPRGLVAAQPCRCRGRSVGQQGYPSTHVCARGRQILQDSLVRGPKPVGAPDGSCNKQDLSITAIGCLAHTSETFFVGKRADRHEQKVASRRESRLSVGIDSLVASTLHDQFGATPEARSKLIRDAAMRRFEVFLRGLQVGTEIT